jgi:NADH:ubiquinone oxidoreductase subunit D
MNLLKVTFFLLLFCPGYLVYADKTPILHPVEEVCVEYKHSGQIMNGKSTRCHRKNAYEQYEIQDFKMGIGGFSQSQKQHTITIGDTIYSINLVTNLGTKTKNPMYESLSTALKKSSPEKMAESFNKAMGFQPTGKSKKILELTCEVYSSPQMGNVCTTKDGLMLEQQFMGNNVRAVKVSFDEGEEENYELYKKVKITEGPDLSNGIPGLFQ